MIYLIFTFTLIILSFAAILHYIKRHVLFDKLNFYIFMARGQCHGSLKYIIIKIPDFIGHLPKH